MSGPALTFDEGVLEAIVDSIVELVADAIAPLRARLDALEARPGAGGETVKDANQLLRERLDVLVSRIVQLEAKPAIEYFGVHETGKAYRLGNAVTKSGSLWIARKDFVKSEPGTDSGWQLAVQRGRDARTERVRQ